MTSQRRLQSQPGLAAGTQCIRATLRCNSGTRFSCTSGGRRRRRQYSVRPHSTSSSRPGVRGQPCHPASPASCVSSSSLSAFRRSVVRPSASEKAPFSPAPFSTASSQTARGSIAQARAQTPALVTHPVSGQTESRGPKGRGEGGAGGRPGTRGTDTSSSPPARATDSTPQPEPGASRAGRDSGTDLERQRIRRGPPVP